jgi:hypothetical protein
VGSGLIKDISAIDAEKRLRKFLLTRFNADECGSEVLSRVYSRLLFQSARGLSRIDATDKVDDIEVSTNSDFKICGDNLSAHAYFPGRRPIRTDAFARNVETDTYFLGEAKGTKDKTGEYGGSTYSCAHRIAHDIISEKKHLLYAYSGFTHSFLSQSLGYLDAAACRIGVSCRGFRFVWLICDDDERTSTKYSNLGAAVHRNLDILFPQFCDAVIFESYLIESRICHYVVFRVNKDKIFRISEYLADKFTKKYFRRGHEMSNGKVLEPEVVDGGKDEFRSSLAVEACLSGLGQLARGFSQYLRYSYEIKELAAKTEIMKKEIETRKVLIDEALKLQSKELDDRRKIIERGLDVVTETLLKSHITKTQLIKTHREMLSKLLDDKISVERMREIRFAMETVMNGIVHMSSEDTIKLGTAVENTKNALNAIPQAKQLLLAAPSGRNS